MAGGLTRAFFRRPVLEVAPDLLGVVVSHAGVSVRLCEVEAYDGENDPGSHGFRGRTKRNATMFGPGGHLYVYFTYGMHWCANLVCGEAGRCSAVLLRAGEVVDGIDVARTRRGSRVADRDLARGPARLTQALGWDRAHDGADLFGGEIRLTRPDGEVSRERVRTGPRVGLRHAADRPWRYWLEDDPYVSAYRPAVQRARRTR
ncbi:MAG TPA: DNA-3-methyladenine glycosylase [Nocardioidaceae bacterium]|nr:DNA-3-methyladenine glycosylase [Nocardioidaceae bacterium]